MTKLLRVKPVVIVMIFSLCYIGNMQRILNIRGLDKAPHNNSNQLFSDGTIYYGRPYASDYNAMHTLDLNQNTSISTPPRVEFSARQNVPSFPNSKTFGSKGLHLDHTSDSVLISDRLCANVPFVAGRVGMAEVFTVQDFLSGKIIHGGRGDPKTASGIYPVTTEGLKAFASVYVESLKSLEGPDLLATFPNIRSAEMSVFPKTVSDTVRIVHHRSLEPYYIPDKPWSRCLLGKTVLIIHPFRDSIECQLRRASDLFPGTTILPNFSTKFVKMFQCLGGSKCPHRNWQETLRATMELIDGVGHFDVAIIGAGSYSLPLAVYCKQKKGAAAIVMGGSSQLLFGLKGRRWDTHPILRNLYNGAWIYPLGVDTPSDAGTIEQGGPYWGNGAQVKVTCPVTDVTQRGTL